MAASIVDVNSGLKSTSLCLKGKLAPPRAAEGSTMQAKAGSVAVTWPSLCVRVRVSIRIDVYRETEKTNMDARYA